MSHTNTNTVQGALFFKALGNKTALQYERTDMSKEANDYLASKFDHKDRAHLWVHGIMSDEASHTFENRKRLPASFTPWVVFESNKHDAYFVYPKDAHQSGIQFSIVDPVTDIEHTVGNELFGLMVSLKTFLELTFRAWNPSYGVSEDELEKARELHEYRAACCGEHYQHLRDAFNETVAEIESGKVSEADQFELDVIKTLMTNFVNEDKVRGMGAYA